VDCTDLNADQTAAQVAIAAMASETVTVRMSADIEPPFGGEAPLRHGRSLLG
jgi:hypothetical protein